MTKRNTLATLSLIAVSACAGYLLGVSSAQAAQQLQEPGVLLRDGDWSTDLGSLVSPAAFLRQDPSKWPAGGWYRYRIGSDRIQGERVVAPKGKLPPFLATIASQLTQASSAPQAGVDLARPSEAAVAAEWQNQIYLRVPGSTLRTGDITVYRFKNGTPTLRPKLDFRYELFLDQATSSQPFAVTVSNGLRGRDGTPYGSGAQYKIEYDGKVFDYSLGDYGWDSTITAIADLDGDGKPDFVIAVGGSGSSYEAVLLSSKAKPGRNPATASLTSMSGC